MLWFLLLSHNDFTSILQSARLNVKLNIQANIQGCCTNEIIVQVQGNMSQWGLKISPILKCSVYCVVCFVDLFLVSTIFIHSSSLLPEDDHRAQNVLLICMSACHRLRSFCQIKGSSEIKHSLYHGGSSGEQICFSTASLTEHRGNLDIQCGRLLEKHWSDKQNICSICLVQ